MAVAQLPLPITAIFMGVKISLFNIFAVQMRQFASFILIVVLALPLVLKVSVMVNYLARQSSYAELCINKDKNNNCEGKCLMVKELRSTELQHREPGSIPLISQLEVSVFEIPESVAFVPIYEQQKHCNTPFDDDLISNFCKSIFQPPRV